jgi:alkylation response protein AidB-like acyl-CoA dehydrogenase
MDDLRDEARRFLADHWHAGRSGKAWVEEVIDAGFAVPSWPVEWHGRGLTPDHSKAVLEEFQRAGAPGAGQDLHNLWANTVLAFGSDDLKRRFVRPLLLNEVRMCLLYSEPNAGSDLAAVQTRAERDGDEWVVNGQKVWTSGAKEADYGMLLARTDWDVPKHRGLTFFWFPMKQDGVEVRPLRQITNEAHFNEVFMTDARVPDTNVVGALNDGWHVLQTALRYERALMGEMARTTRNAGDPSMRSSDAEALPTAETFDLAALATDRGRAADPLVRQEVARLYELRMVNRWNGRRAAAEMEQRSSSSLASLGKLAMSRILHDGAKVQALILGAEALQDGDDAPAAANANFLALNAYFTSIGGGTDQIQRNIIGERILGLPREPEVDKDVPFREVRKSV